jgi:murein DD-endopeptidase MepM/ murein hydrolase activator NlpD
MAFGVSLVGKPLDFCRTLRLVNPSGPVRPFLSDLQEGRLSAKKFAILIIPEGSHKVRRFSVKRGVVQSIAGLVVVLVLILGWVLVDYTRTSLDRNELQNLRSQNRTQETELRKLSASLESLREEMVVLAQNDAKVRVMAQLSRPKSDVLAGIGGPPESDATTDFASVQKQIDQIVQAIDLRRESQEEIQAFLSDQRSLLASKPKGWPSRGWMTSGFGMRRSPFSGKPKMHEGLDIAASIGTPVYATADGIVSQSETVAGYGKLVVIDHGYGYKTYYGHNSKLSVKVGQKVRRGDRIASVGNSGSSTGAHLHYEVRLNGVPLNPRKYL